MPIRRRLISLYFIRSWESITPLCPFADPPCFTLNLPSGRSSSSWSRTTWVGLIWRTEAAFTTLSGKHCTLKRWSLICLLLVKSRSFKCLFRLTDLLISTSKLKYRSMINVRAIKFDECLIQKMLFCRKASCNLPNLKLSYSVVKLPVIYRT